MGAKSSIHTQGGHGGYVSHNDRSQKTANSIFPENKNEIWNYQKEAFSMYRSELAARSEAYTKRTGQKLQAKAITHLSAVVNLNEHHTLQDVRKVAEYLEKTFDTKVFQIAVHRDEGHVNDMGEKIVNYHAHIEYMGLDTKGQSVRKKLTKSALTKLQSNTAELLGMERGRNYAKERAPRPKRLDTYDYKNKAEALQTQRQQSKRAKEQGKDLVRLKDVQNENKTMRAMLKERGASRNDYSQLEKTIRDLKARARARELSFKDLEIAQEELFKRLGRADIEKRYFEAKIANLEANTARLNIIIDLALDTLGIKERTKDGMDVVSDALKRQSSKKKITPEELLKHLKDKLSRSTDLARNKVFVSQITKLNKQIKAEKVQEKQKVRDKSKGREL